MWHHSLLCLLVSPQLLCRICSVMLCYTNLLQMPTLRIFFGFEVFFSFLWCILLFISFQNLPEGSWIIYEQWRIPLFHFYFVFLSKILINNVNPYGSGPISGFLARMSALSFPSIPTCPETQQMVTLFRMPNLYSLVSQFTSFWGNDIWT